MSKRLSDDESLSKGRFRGSKRIYNGSPNETTTLSPGRIGDILIQVRQRHREDFEKIKSVPEIFNSKCRQCKKALKRKLNGNSA